MAARPGKALQDRGRAQKIPRFPENSYVCPRIAHRICSRQSILETIFAHLDPGCRRCATLQLKHLTGLREVADRVKSNNNVEQSTFVCKLRRALCNRDLCDSQFLEVSTILWTGICHRVPS